MNWPQGRLRISVVEKGEKSCQLSEEVKEKITVMLLETEMLPRPNKRGLAEKPHKARVPEEDETEQVIQNLQPRKRI